MLEYLLRFIAGGTRSFRIRGVWRRRAAEKLCRPVGAAPSIALATILITLSQKGAPFAAVEGRSMIVGALGLAAYSWTACLLLKRFMMPSWAATMAALIVWFAVAFGLSAILFGPP